MKPLESYKTEKRIEKDLNKEGLKVDYNYSRLLPSSRDPYCYYDNNAISFYPQNSVFCCAYDEIGDFYLCTKYNKFWPYLIKAWLLGNRVKFTRCSTLSFKAWKPLEAALLQVGFVIRAKLKSNHGRYKVTLWEYIK